MDMIFTGELPAAQRHLLFGKNDFPQETPDPSLTATATYMCARAQLFMERLYQNYRRYEQIEIVVDIEGIAKIKYQSIKACNILQTSTRSE